MRRSTLCQCGCGKLAPISDRNIPSKGVVKGQPRQYIKNHDKRHSAAQRGWEVLFWSHVQKTDTCWLWTGQIIKGGYGLFNLNRSQQHFTRVAHRVAYELLVGPIPEGLTLDHVRERCNNTNCVNPAHLEPVTQRENLLRGNTVNARNAAKTHCIHGHEFTPENTYIRLDFGTRMCKECSRINAKRAYERRS